MNGLAFILGCLMVEHNLFYPRAALPPQDEQGTAGERQEDYLKVITDQNY